MSSTPRFIAYQLELDTPTRYLYDGEYRDMTAFDYAIDVLEDDGSLSTESRTLYKTHWGPMFSVPGLGWTSYIGFTYRDVNDNNLEMAATWFGMNQATSLETFQGSHKEHHGIP